MVEALQPDKSRSLQTVRVPSWRVKAVKLEGHFSAAHGPLYQRQRRIDREPQGALVLVVGTQCVGMHVYHLTRVREVRAALPESGDADNAVPSTVNVGMA